MVPVYEIPDASLQHVFLRVDVQLGDPHGSIPDLVNTWFLPLVAYQHANVTVVDEPSADACIIYTVCPSSGGGG